MLRAHILRYAPECARASGALRAAGHGNTAPYCRAGFQSPETSLDAWFTLGSGSQHRRRCGPWLRHLPLLPCPACTLAHLRRSHPPAPYRSQGRSVAAIAAFFFIRFAPPWCAQGQDRYDGGLLRCARIARAPGFATLRVGALAIRTHLRANARRCAPRSIVAIFWPWHTTTALALTKCPSCRISELQETAAHILRYAPECTRAYVVCSRPRPP